MIEARRALINWTETEFRVTLPKEGPDMLSHVDAEFDAQWEEYEWDIIDCKVQDY